MKQKKFQSNRPFEIIAALISRTLLPYKNKYKWCCVGVIYRVFFVVCCVSVVRFEQNSPAETKHRCRKMFFLEQNHQSFTLALGHETRAHTMKIKIYSYPKLSIMNLRVEIFHGYFELNTDLIMYYEKHCILSGM